MKVEFLEETGRAIESRPDLREKRTRETLSKVLGHSRSTTDRKLSTERSRRQPNPRLTQKSIDWGASKRMEGVERPGKRMWLGKLKQ